MVCQAPFPRLSYAYDCANWFGSGPAGREDNNHEVQCLTITLPARLSGAGARLSGAGTEFHHHTTKWFYIVCIHHHKTWGI
jgi:hypothetical protein